MNYLPLIIFAVVIAGLIAFSARARRRQATAQAEQAERIGVGTQVMTTSGLHGTVVVRNDDDTVQLSIAPGVEVRWELAALRDLAALPDKFHREPGPAEEHESADDSIDVNLDKPER